MTGGAVLGHAIHMHDLICDILGSVVTINAFTDSAVYCSARQGGVPVALPVARDHADFQCWLPE